MNGAGTIVWVEPLVPNDIGASGPAYLLDDGLGERVEVRMIDSGMTLSVPRHGVLEYVEP